MMYAHSEEEKEDAAEIAIKLAETRSDAECFPIVLGEFTNWCEGHGAGAVSANIASKVIDDKKNNEKK
jgi:hypothetical protein